MKVIVFDTETISVDKPFCYNIGYVIVDYPTGFICEQKEFVIEQIWHNPPLFSTAYYANKKSFYINGMRAKKIKMEKYGYVCQEMMRDIKKYNIEMAFAYNSSFDERVFNFNCDWFKCNNPFDNVEIKDIRGYVHHSLMTKEFFDFCEKHEKFTESGNYSTTAETIYQYITSNEEFIESHTALDDSIIETEILFYTLSTGKVDIENNYKAKNSIPREIEKYLTVRDIDNNEYIFTCKGYTVYKKKDLIKLK